MDLFRLKTYIIESIRQYERLSILAKQNNNTSLSHAHWYSSQVGKSILEEIDYETRLSHSDEGKNEA